MGRIMYRSKLCRIRALRNSNGEVIEIQKTRRMFSNVSLAVARCFPCLISGLKCLSLSDWQKWEAQAWHLFNAHELKFIRNGIVMPALKGAKLGAILSSTADDKIKLQALRAAVEALRRSHATIVTWPDAAERPFSHADTHAGNVFYDPASQRATWFDFELIHDPSMPAETRHADDLRALSFSAAAKAPDSLWPAMAETVVNAIGSVQVLSELHDLSRRICANPTMAHVAQARMAMGKHRLWAAILERAMQRPQVRFSTLNSAL